MSTVSGTSLETADIIVIVVYFVIVISFGLWSSLLNRGSIGGYFLAGRSMNFLLVGASLFASNIGSGHFIGLGGSGASSGIGTSAFELNAMFTLVFLGWLFLPVYIASGVFTMPEYLRKRFGGQRIRVYLAVLAIILSIFTKVAADLYAGAIFIQVAVGWNLYASVGILLVIAALFTITGGLTAVIWTDFIQTIIMLIGAFYLMIYSFGTVNGYENVRYEFFRAVSNTTFEEESKYHNATCGIPTQYSYSLFRPANDPEYPWTGIIFGLTISGVWYWCTDQVIVQRALASRNYSHGKGGCILAAYLKFLPMWIIVFPGMIARILFPDEVACSDPDICEAVCDQRTGCTNIAYPLLVVRLMPVGARGLMLAVMMAALMSSLTSIFNSSATIFTMDIWILLRKKAKDTELMIVSRIFVLGMVGISIAWLPIVQSFSELFHYIQSVTSFLSPPICAVYVLAVFWKRTNEKGAFWGLMCGLIVGMTRFIWESCYPRVPCGEEDKRPDIISKVHYLHFGMLLFGLVMIITVVISLLTEPIPEEHLERLIFWNRYSTKPRVDLAHGDRDEMNNKQDDNEEEETRCWKKSLNWVCGVEKTIEPTEDEKLELEKKHTSLEEDPFWKKFCDINVIVMMTCACFIWGFFA